MENVYLYKSKGFFQGWKKLLHPCWLWKNNIPFQKVHHPLPPPPPSDCWDMSASYLLALLWNFLIISYFISGHLQKLGYFRAFSTMCRLHIMHFIPRLIFNPPHYQPIWRVYVKFWSWPKWSGTINEKLRFHPSILMRQTFVFTIEVSYVFFHRRSAINWRHIVL